MKLFNFFLFIGIPFLASCGGKHNIPELNSSKWKEYDYHFYNYDLKHKYPGTDGNNEYDLYKKRVDVGKLRKDGRVIFFGEWYDIYEYPHFEIMISLVKYKNEEENIPSIDLFVNDIIASLRKEPLRDGKTYQKQKVTINGTTYLKIVFFNKNSYAYREIYLTPLNKYCYLTISADYKEAPKGEKDWLISRRKIFKEFAENVTISQTDHKVKK